MSGHGQSVASFGLILREARASAGLTQAELAELSGLSVRAISDMERGRSLRPYRGSIQLLVKGLGLSGDIANDLFRAARANRAVKADGGLAVAGDGAAQGAERAPSVAVVPRQLPSPPAHFAGRRGELDALSALVDQAQSPGRAVRIAAISGTAGVGKTALAVHWAHQMADRFPDGQLFLDMRGYGPAGEPVRPPDAIRWLLDGLAVAPERVPASIEAQIGLYRSLLAARRVLVVLDNALNADQVRPLLAGSPGSMVLVTSRNQLTSLVARDSAKLLPLDLLTGVESYDLLVHCLGAERLDSDSATTAELIELCARLPLALSIAGAQLAEQPCQSVGTVTAQLRDQRDRLRTLDAGDAAASVRSVLSWSYEGLSAGSRRTFRLLGVHPGPDITAAATASLAGTSLPAAQRALAELLRAHLVAETSPGRYSFHCLLRAYAAEQAEAYESARTRAAALRRALDHYLHAAHAADRLLDAARYPIIMPPPAHGVFVTRPADRAQAQAWLDTEHHVLLAAIGQAHQEGLDTHAWSLAMCLVTFFYQRAYWHQWAATLGSALMAAQRLADDAMVACAHLELARAMTLLSWHDQAHAHVLRALELHGGIGDLLGQARGEQALVDLFDRQGRYAEALRAAERSHDLYVAAGHRAGTARALNNAGWCHAMLGDFQRAISCCQAALDLQVEVGDRYGQAHTWDSLGCSYELTRDHGKAVACYNNAIALYGQLDDHYYQASTLTRLAESHHSAGDLRAARSAWKRALTILEDLGHSSADQVRRALGKTDARRQAVLG